MKMASFPNEVSCAYDGYTGLIRIGEMRPNLLVLDIMMPEINGLELLHRLRSSQEAGADMRILVLTGAKDRDLVVRNIQDAAPDALLFKPVGVNELLETVNRLINTGGTARQQSNRHG